MHTLTLTHELDDCRKVAPSQVAMLLKFEHWTSETTKYDAENKWRIIFIVGKTNEHSIIVYLFIYEAGSMNQTWGIRIVCDGKAKRNVIFSFSQSLSLFLSLFVSSAIGWRSFNNEGELRTSYFALTNRMTISFFFHSLCRFSLHILSTFCAIFVQSAHWIRGVPHSALNLWHGGILYFPSNTIFRVYSCIIRPKFSHSSLLIWCDNARNDSWEQREQKRQSRHIVIGTSMK